MRHRPECLALIRQTVTACRQALALYQEVDYKEGQAGTWDTLGYAHHHLGDHSQALTCYRRALALFRELDDRYYQASILSHIGDTQLATGTPGDARQTWHEALTILKDLDHPDAAAVSAKLSTLDGDRAATEI